jgi:hypothetical protein
VAIGLSLLAGWLAVFTVGSQLPSQGQNNPIMQLLTCQASSTLVLGILASCLGLWRRRYLEPSATTGGAEAYVSAAISGFVCMALVQAFPSLFAGFLDFSKDQSTYNSFALAGSFIAFLSGMDQSFFENLICWVRSKLGLSDRVNVLDGGPSR